MPLAHWSSGSHNRAVPFLSFPTPRVRLSRLGRSSCPRAARSGVDDQDHRDRRTADGAPVFLHLPGARPASDEVAARYLESTRAGFELAGGAPDKPQWRWRRRATDNIGDPGYEGTGRRLAIAHAAVLPVLCSLARCPLLALLFLLRAALIHNVVSEILHAIAWLPQFSWRAVVFFSGFTAARAPVTVSRERGMTKKTVLPNPHSHCASPVLRRRTPPYGHPL